MVLHKLKGSITALALAGLVGCASMASYERPQVTLIDPSSKPKEEWSEALVMFTQQMGIYGMQDASADSTHATAAGVVNRSQTQSHGAEMGIIAQSVAVGALFFVLDSGPANRMINRFQIAFWVPADEVSSAEEASELVAEQWTDIRRKVVDGKREVTRNQITVSGYPISHPKAFGSIRQELKNERPPYEGAPKHQKVGNNEGLFYGPIFVHPGSSWLADSAATKLWSTPDLMDRYGQEMPINSMLYYHGESAPKIYDPAFVMHNKQKYFFKVEG